MFADPGAINLLISYQQTYDSVGFIVITIGVEYIIGAVVSILNLKS